VYYNLIKTVVALTPAKHFVSVDRPLAFWLAHAVYSTFEKEGDCHWVFDTSCGTWREKSSRAAQVQNMQRRRLSNNISPSITEMLSLSLLLLPMQHTHDTIISAPAEFTGRKIGTAHHVNKNSMGETWNECKIKLPAGCVCVFACE